MTSRIARAAKLLFSKHLLVTNTVVSGTLLATGDLITQNLEIRYEHQKAVDSKDGDACHKKQIDWKRTGIIC